MTLTETSQSPDHALGASIRAKSQLGTHLHPDADPQTALFVERGTGTLGDNQSALSIRPGTGLVRGTAHTIATEQTQDIDGGSGDPRRDVVYLDDTGAIAVEKGTPAQRSWPRHIDENQQTTTNAVRPAPPDMAAIDGLPLAVIDVGENAGTLGTGAITDVRAPAPAASVGGVATVASDLVDAQEALDAGAGDGVRVALDSGTYLNNDVGTIHVRPNTTLELREGAVIEPATAQDMVRLRGAGGVSTASAGRLLGPGTLRSRPGALEASTLASFDGAAHILVDGADDIRPSRAPDQNGPRGTASRLTENVHIDGDLSATGGYGIHLRATGGFDYVWLQDFHAHIYGCEHAIRNEATGADSASINGNRFYGTYTKPQRIVHDTVGDPAANDISHNEFRGTGQASDTMAEMYHIEGKEWQRRGTDFDLTRAADYVVFTAESQGNYFAPDTADLIPAGSVADAGTRNVVTVASEREFASHVWATLSADQPLAGGTTEPLEVETATLAGHDERADVGGEFDDATHRYTANTRGTVAVDAHAQFVDGTRATLTILKNGTGVWAGENPSATLGVERNDEVWVTVDAPAGDATVDSAPDATALSIHKID